MHVLQLGPNFFIKILQLSPVMQTAQSRCGISSFLDNLNIDMIYGSEKMANDKRYPWIVYSFKSLILSSGRSASHDWQRWQMNRHLICGNIQKLLNNLLAL